MPNDQRLALLARQPIDVQALALPDGGPEDVPAERPPPRSRVQLFKTGRFKHPRTGKFTISRQTLDGFERNFAASVPTDRIPGDFDHAPEFGGDTRANGWIVSLDRPRADELWGTVEWTWNGAWAIRDREYRYVSPSFYLNFQRDDETKVGPTIVGFALTNRPFLEQMAAVTLARPHLEGKSDDELLELALATRVDEPERSDSPPPMADELTLTAPVREALGVEDGADEAAVLAAITAKGEPEGDVIVLGGTTFESLEKAAEAQGKALVAKADVTEAQTLRKDVEDLRKTVADQEFDAAFTAALTDEDGPKVAPAERDDFRALFDRDREAFEKTLSLRRPLEKTAPKGGGGSTDEAPDGEDADSFRLNRQVEARMAEKDEDYPTALNAVLAEQEREEASA